MRKWLPMILCLYFLVMPVSALEISAPTVPEAGKEWMPEQTESFSQGLLEMLQKAIGKIRPDLKEAVSVSMRVLSAVLLTSVLGAFSPDNSQSVNMAGTVCVAAILFAGTKSMILLAGDTVRTLSDYGKLFIPVMTGALAAQGGLTASAGLYIGTAFFDSLLGTLLSSVFVPAVFLYLALSVAGGAGSEDVPARLRDMIRSTFTWSLKTLLTVFTTYMSITGVISGTTDAAALKATKVTISSVVPVVGGILSDASEAVLVSAGVMKNAAGIYGIFAILALCLEPFAKIGVHYLILKGTAALSCIFGSKRVTGVVGDFSTAMGMLLAITGAMCLLLLISTVCFMKGVG